MREFKVTLSKVLSAQVCVNAESAEDAMDEAVSRYMRGEVELDGGYVQDGVQTIVEDAHPADTQLVPIYWNDLTESKQHELLGMLDGGVSDNAAPIAVVVVPNGKEGQSGSHSKQ